MGVTVIVLAVVVAAGTGAAGQVVARAGLGHAFSPGVASGRDAILRPLKPQITLSARVLLLAAGHDTGPEAAEWLNIDCSSWWRQRRWPDARGRHP